MLNSLLIDVLSLPSYSGMEEMVRNFVVSYCKKRGYKVEVDKHGNVFVTKGYSRFYPCIAAHMDTVHESHIELIKANRKKELRQVQNDLYAVHPVTGKRIGLGGDNLCGVYICLELLGKVRCGKAAFFVEEEIDRYDFWGQKIKSSGAERADFSFFDDVSYCLEFDGPTNNWFNPWCNQEFLSKVEPVLKNYRVTNHRTEDRTDVFYIARECRISTCNLPVGYFKFHTESDYVDVSSINRNLQLGMACINALGDKRYFLT